MKCSEKVSRVVVVTLAVFLWAGSGLASAESIKFSGVVRERGTGRYLEGVSVYLLPEKIKALSDASGRFDLVLDSTPLNPPSEIEGGAPAVDSPRKLVFTSSRFERAEVEVSKLENTSSFEIFLLRETYNAFETTVVDQAQKKELTKKSLKTSEFLKVPGSGGDPVKAVQNLPGVARGSSMSSQVVIQGAGPQDTKYEIEGHTIPLVFHFGGFSSVVIPEAVERVDYLSAGFGVEKGRAQAGLVGLSVKDPETDRNQGLVFVDLLNSGFMLQGPINQNQSYLVAGRQSYIGWILKKVLAGKEGFNLTVAPSFQDLTGVYEYRLDSSNRFKFVAVQSHDALSFLLENPVDADPSIRGNFNSSTSFYRLIPKWTHKFSDASEINLSLAAGNDSISFDVGSNYFSIDSQVLSARGDWTQTVSPLYTFSIGWDNTYNWTNFKIKLPVVVNQGGVLNPISSGEVKASSGYQKAQNIGLYLRNDFTFLEARALQISPNLRLDHFSETREFLPQPRLAARYAISESVALKLATGIYYQPPEPGQTDSTFGNPLLNSPRAYHYLIGVDRDFRGGASSGWQFSSDFFAKQLDRQVIQSSVVSSVNGVERPELYNNSGRGDVFGIQNKLEFKDTWQSLSLLYTLSRSRRWTTSESRHPSEYDQTHLFGLLASRELGENWSIGARVRYSTGNPYTPVKASYYDNNRDVFVPERGALYSKRLPGFFQADLRADKKWIFRTWILSAYLDVQNITARKNVESKGYSFDYTQSSDTTGIPGLVILGAKGEF